MVEAAILGTPGRTWRRMDAVPELTAAASSDAKRHGEKPGLPRAHWACSETGPPPVVIDCNPEGGQAVAEVVDERQLRLGGCQDVPSSPSGVDSVRGDDLVDVSSRGRSSPAERREFLVFTHRHSVVGGDWRSPKEEVLSNLDEREPHGGCAAGVCDADAGPGCAVEAVKKVERRPFHERAWLDLSEVPPLRQLTFSAHPVEGANREYRRWDRSKCRHDACNCTDQGRYWA